MRCGSSCSCRQEMQQPMQPCCGSTAGPRGARQRLGQVAEATAMGLDSSSGLAVCQAARAGTLVPRASTRCSGVTTSMTTSRLRCVTSLHRTRPRLMQPASEAAVSCQQSTRGRAVQRCSLQRCTVVSGVAFVCAGTRAAAHSKGEEEAGGGATGCVTPPTAERSCKEGGQAGPVLGLLKPLPPVAAASCLARSNGVQVFPIILCRQLVR